MKSRVWSPNGVSQVSGAPPTEWSKHCCASGRRPLALRLWARHLESARSPTVAETHLEWWLSSFWALPARRALHDAARRLADDLRPVPGEQWRTKLSRARLAVLECGVFVDPRTSACSGETAPRGTSRALSRPRRAPAGQRTGQWEPRQMRPEGIEMSEHLRLRSDAVAWREVDGEVIALGLESSTYSAPTRREACSGSAWPRGRREPSSSTSSWADIRPGGVACRGRRRRVSRRRAQPRAPAAMTSLRTGRGPRRAFGVELGFRYRLATDPPTGSGDAPGGMVDACGAAQDSA